MKSRITIDYGIDYKPVIRIQKESSEDVRDKLLASFFQEWGYDTNLLFMANHSAPGGDVIYTIAPMPPEKVIAVMGEEILRAVPATEENFKKVSEFFAWVNKSIDERNGIKG